MNSQYIMSVLCEEYEKQMHEAIMQKVLMNGQVVDMLDKPRFDRIRDKCNKMHKIFYEGDQLSQFEMDIERMYVADKVEKH